jgi:hypothetical protein
MGFHADLDVGWVKELTDERKKITIIGQGAN